MTNKRISTPQVWKRRGLKAVFFTSLLVAWQIICASNIWDETILPCPTAVLESLAHGLRDGTIPAAVSASMKRLFAGYSLSLLIGIPLGLMLGRNTLLDDTAGGLVIGLQGLPSICWLPLAVLWFGLSETAMLFVVVMGSFLSVTLAIRDGVRTTPSIYLRAAQVLGTSRWQCYRYVLLPATLPSLLTGAKLGWSFSWRSLMAAELLYVASGIGSLLMSGRELHDMALVVASMAVIVMIGLCFDRLLFQSAEHSIHKRWGTGQRI